MVNIAHSYLAKFANSSLAVTIPPDFYVEVFTSPYRFPFLIHDLKDPTY